MEIQGNLSVKDLAKYVEKERTGRLVFPNGGRFLSDFSVNLRDVYGLVANWEIQGNKIPIDDISAIIAFGSSVRYPGYREVPVTRKKYVIFGEKQETGKIKRVPIIPNDADFLVVTSQNMTEERVFVGKQDEYDDYYGPLTEDRIIHMFHRGANQVINGVKENDTISISALKEGVPIFYDRAKLEKLVQQSEIASSTPRKLDWTENTDGYLHGEIR